MGRNKKAVSYYRLEYKKNPNDPYVLQMLAELSYQLKDYSKAIKYNKELFAISKKPETRLSIADCYFNLGQRNEAEIILNTSLN